MMLNFILIFLAVNLTFFFLFIFFKKSKSVQSKQQNSTLAENCTYNPMSDSDNHKISDHYSSTDSGDAGGGD